MNGEAVNNVQQHRRLRANGAGRWILMALALLVAPLIFNSGAALSVLSLMVIAIVFALSYNMLFGQTGLLSFGHAVYYGMGAYLTMHALRYLTATGIPFPVELLPLIGGVGGLFFGYVLGVISTRRAGITFAMISLGVGVLMESLAVILRHWFGGDGGLSGDPTAGTHLFGLTLTDRLQIYYLMAVWCAVCIAAMYYFTTTPLGHMANAVRDNPERVEFMGFSPYQVRVHVHTLAGFFAGVAGGMLALTTGIVTPDALGFVNSGQVLMMAYIGGAGIFYGPILGAVVVTYMQVLLSNYTQAWQLYIGLFFVLMLLYVPDGIAYLIKIHIPAARHRQLLRLIPGYVMVGIPGAVFLLGLVLIVQMAYDLHSVHIFLNQSFTFLGVEIDDRSPWSWLLAVAATGGAFWACRPGTKRVRAAWDEVFRQIKTAEGVEEEEPA